MSPIEQLYNVGPLQNGRSSISKRYDNNKITFNEKKFYWLK